MVLYMLYVYILHIIHMNYIYIYYYILYFILYKYIYIHVCIYTYIPVYLLLHRYTSFAVSEGKPSSMTISQVKTPVACSHIDLDPAQQ